MSVGLVSYLLGRRCLFNFGWPLLVMVSQCKFLMEQMLYCINQPCTLSFPIGLVKTESDFIVRSVETGLGRWVLAVAVNGVDAYPFMAFSHLTCQLEDTGMCFLLALCQPISKETKLAINNQEASPSAATNNKVVLVPCLWMSFVKADELSVRVTKTTSRITVSRTHSLPFCFWPILTQWITAILSKGCKPDNFELHNSLLSITCTLVLSITNIWGPHSNFVDCESFLELNSPDILPLCETNLDDSINSGNFSLRGYLPTEKILLHAWSCSLCEGKTSFWTYL